MSRKRINKKFCIVPKCSSTITNKPEKLFFYVPLEPGLRNIWMQAMKLTNPPGAKTSVYCCEDHFDIESDMENYIKFKLVGGKLKLKRGVVPHKFECQELVNTPESINPWTEMIGPIKPQIQTESDGNVPLPMEKHIWEVPITPVGDVKCEYESDPEHDDELRRIRLGQPVKTEPAERDIEGNGVSDNRGAEKLKLATDNASDEKRKIRRVRRQIDVRHQCDMCHKQFSAFIYLKNHLKTQHDSEKLYECNDCGKRYKSLGNLKSHIRIHTGEKPYQCNICRKCFTTSGRRSEHYRTHTGEKPYGCNLCEKRFVNSNCRKRHLRVHTGERPYECSVCKKRFNASGTLKSHFLIHTGEKPYKCDICSRRFAQRNSINVHLKTHASEKQYKCSVCNKQFEYKHDLIIHSKNHTGEKHFE